MRSSYSIAWVVMLYIYVALVHLNSCLDFKSGSRLVQLTPLKMVRGKVLKPNLAGLLILVLSRYLFIDVD